MFSINLPIRITEIINRFRAYSFNAHIAGKCVRELITTQNSIDYDILTDAPVDRICEIFDKYNINTDNIEKGEIIIHVQGFAVLVTPYRKGFLENGRAIYADNIYEDLATRDFSFNAIAYCDRDGFIDPFGGCECLKKGGYTVSAIGVDRNYSEEIKTPPLSAFIRNPVNILLALGYYATGDYVITPETKEGILDGARLVLDIPVDALRTELSWVIRGKRITDVLDEYKDVFSALIPEFLMIDGEDYNRQEIKYDMLTHTTKAVGFASPILTLRYALWFHSLGKPDCFSLDHKGEGHYYGHEERSKIYAERIMSRLGFTEDDIREVCFLIEHHTDELGADRRAMKLRLREIPEDRLIKLLQFKYADLRAQSPDFEGAATNYKRLVDAVNEIAALKECCTIQQLAVNRFDLIECKLAQTEEEAQLILERLLNLVLDAPIYNTRPRLINMAEKWVRAK